MLNEKDRVRLRHMLDYAREAVELVAGTRIVLRNILGLMGLDAPERM